MGYPAIGHRRSIHMIYISSANERIGIYVFYNVDR